MSVIFCGACDISHLQVTCMIEHFVSFGEKQQHDLHVAGENWGLAPENWGQGLEGTEVESVAEIGAKLEKDFQQNKFHRFQRR